MNDMRERAAPDAVIREFIALRNRFFDNLSDEYEPTELEEERAIAYALKRGSKRLRKYLETQV